MIYDHAYYEQHKERILTRQRARRIEKSEEISAKKRIYESTPERKSARLMAQRKYEKLHKAKITRKKRYYRMLKAHNITAEHFQKIHEKQDGKCLICNLVIAVDDRQWCIDHDHVTGDIRGLLCRSCNCGLGNFHDSPKLLRAAIRYLQQRSLFDMRDIANL